MRNPTLFLAAALSLCIISSGAIAQSMDDQIALVRQAHATDREAVITLNVHFTSAESEAFWPVYREYRQVMKANGDLRLGLIKEFAANFNDMNDELATRLMNKSLNIQQDHLDTRFQYTERFAKILPGKKVARIMQMEAKMDAAIEMQLASEIPLVR